VIPQQLLINYVLPSSEDLFWLCDHGVRAFVFRELMLNSRYDESIRDPRKQNYVWAKMEGAWMTVVWALKMAAYFQFGVS